MSPFAYLAHTQLVEIAEKYQRKISYQPIDLVQTKLAAGNTGPSNRQIPRKIAYLMKDLKRWADRYGVPLTTPASHDSEKVNLGAFFAIERGVERRYVESVWKHTWGGGAGDFASAVVIESVVADMDWNLGEFSNSLSSPSVRTRYEQSNLNAQTKGVFGVPTMIVDGEMWWGNDRLFFLEEHLAQARG
jgi:2-hydroxychromene-2-carboxylate isomerase